VSGFLKRSLGSVGIVIFLSIFVLVTADTVFLGCSRAKPAINSNAGINQTVKDTAKIEKRVPGDVYAKLVLVGDIMIHSNLLAAARDRKTGTYSFQGFFDEVKPYLSAADLTVGNLETTLAGREKRYTGYPQFNTPESILIALKEAGFDVLTNANNHAMDRGEYGVVKTVSRLSERGFRYTGTSLSAKDRDKPLIVKAKDINIGLLAYTYGTNGLPVPKGKGFMVNMLDFAKVRADIKKAREDGAQLVVVFPHFGIEYRRIPGKVEKKLVDELFNAGADVVAGSHPHVIQPMSVTDSTSKRKGIFTAYSLGNFISGQRDRYKDSGVILQLEVKKDQKSGQVTLHEARYIPVWVHEFRENGQLKYRLLLVEKAIRDYRAGTDKRISAKDYLRLQQVWQEITSMLSGPGAPLVNHV
jgi:poly-gamma-glutamate capsule biosynthesis protein CapA/YwtB (metallophosphatase superfamily)